MSDRTLFEIVEAVKKNETVDHDDLRYAVMALDSLHTFERMDIERLAEHVQHAQVELRHSESWRRSKSAFGAVPKKWLGPNNLPESEEYQQRRKMAFAILRKVKAQEA